MAIEYTRSTGELLIRDVPPRPVFGSSVGGGEEEGDVGDESFVVTSENEPGAGGLSDE